MTVSRDRLRAAPYSYFDAVDRKDMDSTLAHFADDATLTVASAKLTFSGRGEIRGMFERFFADYATIRHEIRNIVVDEAAQKAATEQHCPHIRADGSPDTVYTCDFFDYGPDGRFSRVIIWIDAVSPLT